MELKNHPFPGFCHTYTAPSFYLWQRRTCWTSYSALAWGFLVLRNTTALDSTGMLFIVIPDVWFLISGYFRYQPGNLLPYGRDLLGGRSGQKISGRVLTKVKEIGKSPSSRIFNVGFWGKGGWRRFYCLSWLASVSLTHVCKAQVLQICKNSQNQRDYEYIDQTIGFLTGIWCTAVAWMHKSIHLTAPELQHPCDCFWCPKSQHNHTSLKRAGEDEMFIQFDHYCSWSTFLNEYRARAVAK